MKKVKFIKVFFLIIQEESLIMDKRGKTPEVLIFESGLLHNMASVIFDAFKKEYKCTAYIKRCRMLDNKEILCEMEIMGKFNSEYLREEERSKRKDCEFLIKKLEELKIDKVVWWQKNWYKKIILEISDILLERNFLVEDYPIQIKGTWERSCVLKIPTNKGNVFFKCSYLTKPSEAVIYEFLTQIGVQEIPEIIYMNVEKNYLLMKDLLDGSPDKELSAMFLYKCIKQYGEIQLRSVQHLESLLKTGIPQLNGQKMKEYLRCIVQFLNDSDIKDDINEIQIYLEEDIRTLYKSLPFLTINNDDFQLGNIINNGKAYIYDWANCCVSHPFFSFMYFLYRYKKINKGKTCSQNIFMFKKAYYQVWKNYISLDEYKTALLLVEKLFHLKEAIRCFLELESIVKDSEWETNNLSYISECMQILIKKYKI